MSKEDLVFVPLGGVGEIGMNLALYGYGSYKTRKWIMVDCGVTFPGPELPGVDLVLPDISFAQSLGDNLLALVITHAHEDHYGAVISLWEHLDCPIYCTDFTAGMLEAKLEYETAPLDLPVEIYAAGDVMDFEPFEVEPIYVNHSIPEPMSLAIKTPLGRIIHTGDWKLDAEPALGKPTDSEKFKSLGSDETGVLALICDSTNAMRDGVSPTETAVCDSLAEIITNSTGRVAITTFSSNVGRIRSIAIASKKAGRKVMLLGSSLRRVVNVSSQLGMFEDIDPFLEEDQFPYVSAGELVIILTGSQGENRAALAKIARQEHRNVSLSASDTVIFSSRTIPGNEKPIIELKNLLIEQGVEIIEDGERLVHVSGHPRRHELLQMYEWTKPEILVPVHGEAAHLHAQAKLGGEAGISQVMPIRNGDLVRLAPGNAEVIDQVQCGRIYKDGYIIGDEEAVGVKERRKLAYVGLIAISLVLNRQGELADGIDFTMHGLPEMTQEGESFDDVVFKAIDSALSGIPKKRRKDDNTVRAAIYKAVRGEVRMLWSKKPVTTIFIARV